MTTLVRLAGIAAVLGGSLRVLTSLLQLTPRPATEAVYLAVDLLLLFAVLGVYAHQHRTAGRVGFCGFLLATSGFASIAGPDGDIGPVSVYAAGSLAVIAGLCFLAVGIRRGPALPRAVPTLWITTTVLGAGAFLAQSTALSAAAGVALGLAFAVVGMSMTRGRRDRRCEKRRRAARRLP